MWRSEAGRRDGAAACASPIRGPRWRGPQWPAQPDPVGLWEEVPLKFAPSRYASNHESNPEFEDFQESARANTAQTGSKGFWGRLFTR